MDTTEPTEDDLLTTEITQANAEIILDKLDAEYARLRAQFDTTDDSRQRATIYRHAEKILRRLAEATEGSRGRRRLKDPIVAQYRREADAAVAAAGIEDLRAQAAERGIALPDPRDIIQPRSEITALTLLREVYLLLLANHAPDAHP